MTEFHSKHSATAGEIRWQSATRLLPRLLRVTRHYWFLLSLLWCYVVGITVPALGMAIRRPLGNSGFSFVTFLMAVLLFCLGTRIRLKTESAQELLPRLDVYLVTRTICVTLGILFGTLGLADQSLMAGLILIFTMPTAGSSSAWCLRLGGSSTASASLILTTTLLWFGAIHYCQPGTCSGYWWTANIGSLARNVAAGWWIQWGWLPLVAGICFGQIKTPSERNVAGKPWFIARLSSTSILLLNLANAASIGRHSQVSTAVWHTCILATAAAFGLAFVAAIVADRLVGDRSCRISARLAASMSNTGLAMAILLQSDSSAEQSLLLVAFTFGQHLATSALHSPARHQSQPTGPLVGQG